MKIAVATAEQGQVQKIRDNFYVRSLWTNPVLPVGKGNPQTNFEPTNMTMATSPMAVLDQLRWGSEILEIRPHEKKNVPSGKNPFSPNGIDFSAK